MTDSGTNHTFPAPRFGCAMALALTLALTTADPLAAESGGLVRLADLAPTIAQDIRYARAFNFTGGPVPGYEAESCMLTPATAEALIRVEADLARQGYGLVVFDCYRPQRAVAFFIDWTEQPAMPEDRPKGVVPALDTPPETLTPDDVFFPGLSRSDLIPKGYLARRSGHSFGHTVDVGLRRKDAPPFRPEFSDASPCTAAFAERTPETGLDLGTAYDCFSPLSAMDADVSAEAKANRRVLLRAMESAGFQNYHAEWWHYRYMRDPADHPFDVPVR